LIYDKVEVECFENGERKKRSFYISTPDLPNPALCLKLAFIAQAYKQIEQ